MIFFTRSDRTPRQCACNDNRHPLTDQHCQMAGSLFIGFRREAWSEEPELTVVE